MGVAERSIIAMDFAKTNFLLECFTHPDVNHGAGIFTYIYPKNDPVL